MPVVAVTRGVRLGTVQGVELDPLAGRIRYLRIKAEDHRPDGVISWTDLRSIGRDAVTVELPQALQEAVPGVDADRLISQFGSRQVVTENGTRLGHITSYEFDPASGDISTYHVALSGLVNRLVHRDLEFTHAEVRSVGADAVVVADDVLPAKAA
jgi:uncharacterized protein YrrD